MPADRPAISIIKKVNAGISRENRFFLIIGSTSLPAKAGTWICSKNEIFANLLKTLFITVVFILSVAYLVNGT